MVVCTSPFQTFLNWILMLSTWPKGCVSFFQCLNFIHLAGIWSLLIHILSTLAPSCVSELLFNMHSRCGLHVDAFEDVFLEASCLHCFEYFCWSCGLSLVLVSALTEMSYIFCVNVTFAMFLNWPLLLMKSDFSFVKQYHLKITPTHMYSS